MSWLESLSAARAKSSFGVTLLKSSACQLAAPVTQSKQAVDKGRMSVTAVLTTYTPDRQGDIVNPVGGDLSEHINNPVVLFHHGKDYRLPIGKAEDPSGNYTVRTVKAHDGDLLIGTTYFAQKSQFAQDVFGLVAEDILRGVSIGFDPLSDPNSVEEIGASPVLDRPALHFKGWKLLEYSHTPIGVNREALTVSYHKSLEGSAKLHPMLERILKPFATPRATTVAGGAAVEKGCIVPNQRAAVSLAKSRKKGKKTPYGRKAEDLDDDALADDDVAANMGGGDAPGGAGDFDPTVDDPSSDPNLPANAYGAGQQSEEVPPTVRTLLDGAQGMSDICAAIEAASKKSEHMEGRKYLADMCAKWRSDAAEMQAMAQKIQAEVAGGPAAEAEGGEGEEGEEGEESEASEGNEGGEVAANAGNTPDADQTTEGEAGEPVEPPTPPEDEDEPETDEEGALVTKGIDYIPRRFTFADINGQAPVPTPRRKQAADETDSEFAQRVKALESENSSLKDQNNSLKDENEQLTSELTQALDTLQAIENMNRR